VSFLPRGSDGPHLWWYEAASLHCGACGVRNCLQRKGNMYGEIEKEPES